MLLFSWSFVLSAGSKSSSLLLFFSLHLSTLVRGAGAIFRQQINISTHIHGPSTHRTGWKLLQSFLWRKEMMPNQPRENGIAQNNGVIEDHWGESPPVLLWAWASRLCPLAWSPHSIALFSPQAWMWPHSANWTPENPHPPTVQHAYTHAHTPHLYLFLSTYYDSQNIAFFLKGSLTHNLLCKGLIKIEESHSGQTNSTKKWKAILVICLTEKLILHSLLLLKRERFSFCPRLYVLVQDCCQIVFSFFKLQRFLLMQTLSFTVQWKKEITVSSSWDFFFSFAYQLVLHNAP